MGFRFAAHPNFKATVAIPQPGEAPQQLTVVFRHKRRTALADWIESLSERSYEDALTEVIEGWEGDTPYTPASLVDMIEEYPAAGRALTQAYVLEASGAERKN